MATRSDHARRLCLLLLAAATMAACSKRPAAPAPGAEKVAERPAKASPAAPKEAAEPEDGGDERAKLEEAYHLIRCTLVGARFAPRDLYAERGFAGAAAFGRAFGRAAASDPRWASEVIERSYGRSCKPGAP